MGKNPHPPRNVGGSKKSLPPPTADGINIVFANDNDAPKKSRGSGASTPSGPAKTKDGDAEDAPKKPSAREIIAGSSWTGKLPVNLLSEHCQKQKWEKPDYTMNKGPDGFLSAVILKSKNPKSGDITALEPFRPPSNMKQLATQPSALEARHFAAAYALFRICSMKNIHMMMPPSYREIWKGVFETQKKQDVATGKAYLYEADPFLAQREKEEAQAQIAKQRAIREKEAAAKAEQPGGGSANLGLSKAKELPKGWRIAPKVEMGTRLRRDVEAIIRTYATWNQYQVKMSDGERHQVVEELVDLGFRKSHVEEATEICRDKEEVLEWLLIHVPEDDLPKWSLPENYTAGISFASGNLKKEAALKRLAIGGYAPELCEDIYDRCGQDERNSAQALQDTLMGENHRTPVGVSINDRNGSAADDVWDEEQAVLASIYESKYEKLSTHTCRVQLELENVSGPAFAEFTRPCRDYPQNPPLLTVSAQLPAYIRLSIIKRALQNAVEMLSGEQMIFNIVHWLEHESQAIVENPGKLSDISNVSSMSSEDSRTIQSTASKRARRGPHPISWKVGDAISMKMLADLQGRAQSEGQIKMTKGRQTLPAWGQQEAIVSAVNSHQVVIISGETGSGKSTQSVQFILDDMIKRQLGGSANIVCTQPRRISALGLADRVAEERCSTVGQEIGYAIRGESKQKPGITKVTFVTTGVLLRRMQTSGGSIDDVVAALADISHVIVDEVHERSLDTDFLLALLRDVLKQRKDLKVILMSATLDADVFEKYFGGPKVCGRVEIQGRTYPVEDLYLDDIVHMTGFGQKQLDEEQDKSDGVNDIAARLRGIGMTLNYDVIAALVQQIDHDLGSTQPGGILIFLPGTMEIQRTLDALKTIPNLHALPLHASLLPAEQRRVFPNAPPGKRKVIAATNVAETSITIPDIVAVIDSGRVKETRYDPFTNMVKLEEVWVSRAAAKQRRGRAGRVSAGKCYKMYTRNAEANKMPERPDPEIRRVPLEQLCLSVKAMGAPDVASFLAGTLTPPDVLAIEGALALLRRMGALDTEAGVLTPLGRHMAMIPADLRCAKLMVHGALFGLLEPCITIAAILTVKSPFVAPQVKREESKAARLSFAVGQGDIVADLRAYDEWVELRATRSPREVRSWCDTNFLSWNILNDIATTRAQYIQSLQEIGFLPYTYRSNSFEPEPEPSWPLLHALILSALYPQTMRITLPPQKYLSTSTGTLAIDPESREIQHFDPEGIRMFIHPSSTLFSAQSFPNGADFLSYFNKVETSRVFVRELSPCGAYGLLLFGGPIALDTLGRGLLVDGWVRLRGWARIGVLVGRLRNVLERIMEKWVEEPGRIVDGGNGWEQGVIDVAKRLIELQGLDR